MSAKYRRAFTATITKCCSSHPHRFKNKHEWNTNMNTVSKVMEQLNHTVCSKRNVSWFRICYCSSLRGQDSRRTLQSTLVSHAAGATYHIIWKIWSNVYIIYHSVGSQVCFLLPSLYSICYRLYNIIYCTITYCINLIKLKLPLAECMILPADT